MIEPTERVLWLLVLIAAVGALGLGVPAVGEAAPFLGGVLLAAMAVDFFLAGSPRAVRARRILPEHLVEGRSADLLLELEATRAFDLEVVDSLPARALPAGASPDRTHLVTLTPDAPVSVRTQASFSRRGPHRLGRIALRARGPLGLVKRRVRLPLTEQIEVLPDVARIGARAERLLRGQEEGGTRRRNMKEGRELDSLREYQSGDDPRLVEWKISARRGQLVVKKMRPETRQEIVVAVDAGRLLSGAHSPDDGGESRLDAAMTTALTLAAAALSRGDRASMIAFAGDILAWGTAGEGRGHLRRLASSMNQVEAAAEESDYGQVARFLIARQKRRAMVVFVTDVLDEPSVRSLAAAVARLRGRHVAVVLALADPALGRLARSTSIPARNDEVDAEAFVPAAALRLLEHRKKGLAALQSAGAVVVDAPAARAAPLAVETYARLKAQGRL